jgi:exosome complex exonuclease DIS3/RRP44
LNKPVLLVGRESMNRSVDGDMVVVEIFPKEQWKAPGEEVLDQDCKSTINDSESKLTGSGSTGR